MYTGARASRRRLAKAPWSPPPSPPRRRRAAAAAAEAPAALEGLGEASKVLLHHLLVLVMQRMTASSHGSVRAQSVTAPCTAALFCETFGARVQRLREDTMVARFLTLGEFIDFGVPRHFVVRVHGTDENDAICFLSPPIVFKHQRKVITNYDLDTRAAVPMLGDVLKLTFYVKRDRTVAEAYHRMGARYTSTPSPRLNKEKRPFFRRVHTYFRFWPSKPSSRASSCLCSRCKIC